VATHNAAAAWNRSLLENAARPSGALVYDAPTGGLSTDQFDRLREELNRAFAGGGNAGRPLLLEGGLKWQSLSMSPADMDFAALKAAAARDIALAFGVPPMLLGLPGDSTYNNYKEANKALWRLTLLPWRRGCSRRWAKAWRLVPRGAAGRRCRPRARAGRGPAGAVDSGECRRLPVGCGKARAAGPAEDLAAPRPAPRLGSCSHEREDMLARLMAQDRASGGDLVTLRAIVEEASELGAERMLYRMGLSDEGASEDLSELRELLQAWRDAKASAWRR
jgi:hypothetical protein